MVKHMELELDSIKVNKFGIECVFTITKTMSTVTIFIRWDKEVELSTDGRWRVEYKVIEECIQECMKCFEKPEGCVSKLANKLKVEETETIREPLLQKVLELIKNHMESERYCTRLKKLRELAKSQGIKEKELEAALKKLRRRGDIIELRPGCFAPVD